MRPGYGWEPLPLYDFIVGMRVAGSGSGSGRSFLDVGSGIGEKLAVADLMGWRPEGVERCAQLAESCVGAWPYPVHVCDAFDFDDYARFDLIYCYRPCVEVADQDELNHVIAARMRPGALFFSAGGPWPDWLEHVGGQVWRSR